MARPPKMNLYLEQYLDEIISIMEYTSWYNIAQKYNCGINTIKRFLKYKNIELIKKDRIKLYERYKKYTLNESFFENIDNEINAYWLGFLYADGCVMDNHKMALLIHKRDTDHMEKFKKDISSTYPIRDAGRDRIHMICSSRKICQDLISHGCMPRKTFNLKFPILREDLIRHFIRGYMDGDGSIFQNNKGECAISFTGQPEFLYSMNKVFINMGISKKIYHGKGCSELRITKKKDFYKLGHWMYENATVFMDRKQERFMRYIEQWQP